jgi:hypothetical protein
MKKLVLVVLMVFAVGCSAKSKETLDNVVDDIKGVVCPDTYEEPYKACEEAGDRLEAALSEAQAGWDRCERDWAKYQSKSTLRR